MRTAVVTLVLLLSSAVAFAQLPDTPSSAVFKVDDHYCVVSQFGKTHCQPIVAHYLTLRGDFQLPPLRTNKQVLTSKHFLLGHGLAAASLVVACTHKGSGEECSTESIAVAGLTAVDYVSERLLWRPFSTAGFTYMIQHYIRARLK